MAYNIELSDEDQAQNDQRQPRAPNTTQGAEGELVNGVSLDLPGPPEAQVGDIDGHPGENRGKTRQRKQPIKEGRSDVRVHLAK